MSILTVYKASAGSGKTFQLTTEYLKIIFKNPEEFRLILAVTFTHKATAEMKARILRELHNLSLRKESHISNILCSEIGFTPDELFKQASIILKKILHHYSHFHISTIDSFFQGIISSFARDLGLQANFAVELNSDKVLNAVVDSLLLNLEKDPALAKWLVDFAEEKVMLGETWELKEEIQKLGKELFREEYAFEQLQSSSDSHKEIIARFRNDYIRLKKEKERSLVEIGIKAENEISQAGLKVEDFSFGWKGVMGYLLSLVTNPTKEPKGRAYEASLSSEKWANKSSGKREFIILLAENKLKGLLLEAIELYTQYFTLELLHSNIYTLGILSDLQSSISAYSQDHNLFLLDQSPWLINRLMDSNDAPFIYEKAGNQFQYFMIDEFQDTSILQWKNFQPLIENSLSQNKPSILVGDVKQSIYRWRNSSWKTLSNIKDEPDLIKVLPLVTNWRSRPLIIRFNNSLFTLASRKLQDFFDENYKITGDNINPFANIISSAYAGLKQEIPFNSDDNSGYAGIRFIERKTDSDIDDEGSEINSPDPALLETKQFIDKLLNSNYRQKDIAILVRTKKEGTAIAEFLVNQKSKQGEIYRVISNDALYLEKSSGVKLLVAVINWIVDEKNECNNLFLAAEFADKQQMNQEKKVFPFYFRGNDITPFIPDELANSKKRLALLPLFDLVEHIISLLRLTEDQGQYPYLQAFIDVVHDYCTTEAAGIPSFLEWWKENSISYTIKAPEEQDAIRIITIHKAKGLEFKAVIVPFCKWDIDHKYPNTPILWCDTSETEYSQLGLVPIRYKEKISESIFAGTYYDEKIQSYVDNLNLLYVAFTRAKDCLFAICELSGNKLTKIGNLIHEALYDSTGITQLKDLDSLALDSFVQKDRIESGLVEFGAIPAFVKSEFVSPETQMIKKISLPGNRIHIRAHTEEYFLPLLNPEREDKINRGLMIHQALSGIQTSMDIKPVLEKMLINGTITSAYSKELEEEISEMIKDPMVENWFTSKWEIKRETGILEKGAGMLRPDRIMVNNDKVIVVDYKTGETENSKYRYQLKKYMSALRNMGYSEINGYIWYLRLKKVVEIYDTE